MKALKSKLASQLLADPAASDQLRDFLVNRNMSRDQRQQAPADQFIIRSNDGVVAVRATVVPKAKAA
jgi:hypothetical protein